jgi:hypothetical protein
MEPDFMNLNKTHRQHEQEMIRMKDNNHRMMIGRKYFKTKSLNFLTFNEKEQIRDLHEREPDEWTIDQLSQAFPADPLTISLILRAKWQPKDVKRITKHDEAVIKNWNEFKKGNLQVEPVLAEHLKKFAFRDFNALTEPKPNRKLGVQIPKPRKSEFASIITSCKKNAVTSEDDTSLRQIPSQESRIPEERPLVDADNFMLEGKRHASSKNITLHELQKINPQLQVKETPSEMTKFEEAPMMKVSKMKKQDNEMTMYVKDTEQVLESLEIEQRIKIPKKLYQKGKIYQVQDCFYADDGDFLYRVPGFIKQ